MKNRTWSWTDSDGSSVQFDRLEFAYVFLSEYQNAWLPERGDENERKKKFLFLRIRKEVDAHETEKL